MEAQGARWEFTIPGSLFVGYMAFILSRTLLAVASPEMVNDPHLGLDEASYGDVAAWGFDDILAGLADAYIAQPNAFGDFRRSSFAGRIGTILTFLRPFLYEHGWQGLQPFNLFPGWLS